MEIRKISDIHLEANRTYSPLILDNEKNQTLVLAGDICEFQRTSILNPFIEEMSERFKYVVYVPGNHEYYGGHIPNDLRKAVDRYSHLSNVHLLDDSAVTLDGVRFVGCTLWTDMNKGNPVSMFEAGLYMNDYKKIRVANYRKLKVVETIGMHLKSISFLKRELLEKAERTVVVSHHAPSLLSLAEKYRGDSLNAAYMSDLSELMYEFKPDLWFHGHVHNNFDYKIYNTRVVCNPRGYSSYARGAENPSFDEKLVIEI